jgi:hypothetical protein
MKLGYCPFIDLLSTDIPCVVDASVEWELGTPHLVIDNILDSTGKVSLMHHETKAFSELAYLIADMAEACPGLLFRAVEQDTDERAAA